MNPRQARRERREAGRKAKKLDLKKSRLSGNLPPSPSSLESLIAEDCPGIQPRCPSPSSQDLLPKRTAKTSLPSQPKEIGFVSQRRTGANRANSKLSTGPRTADGKLASSRNSTKHGLASGTLIIPGEDPAAFETLLNDLLEEHQPATATEDLLIQEIAQSFWLTQRAIRLQNGCFTGEGVNEKQLALFLRYQASHERCFYKALNCLIRLKKDAARDNRRFVSQPSRRPTPDLRFVSQSGVPTPIPHQFVPQKPDSYGVEAS
jgi:hypothetical protein